MHTLPPIPDSEDELVIRTDFSDQSKWDWLRNAIVEENELGFKAYVEFLEDERYRNLSIYDALKLVQNYKPSTLFLVDTVTMTHPENPVLCIDLKSWLSFRVIPSAMWDVQNNLSICNVDFEDYLSILGEDGIYRGLPE